MHGWEFGKSGCWVHGAELAESGYRTHGCMNVGVEFGRISDSGLWIDKVDNRKTSDVRRRVSLKVSD